MEIESTVPAIIEELLVQEKTARLNSEAHKSVELLVQITELLYRNRQYDELFAQLVSLSKKRGQSKKAITSMVQQCMGYIETLSNLDFKLRLIETLKEVCDKKIYLEVEYARCCLMMVKWNENQANIEKAANIMQEVQVETYGSMDKREKLEFILYQMKIMIKLKDVVRLFIVSKKIQPKSLEVPRVFRTPPLTTSASSSTPTWCSTTRRSTATSRSLATSRPSSTPCTPTPPST